jgi:mannose/fructose/N-acetylgalactosamine-specific phosphotransferase system component IIC
VKIRICPTSFIKGWVILERCKTLLTFIWQILKKVVVSNVVGLVLGELTFNLKPATNLDWELGQHM